MSFKRTLDKAIKVCDLSDLITWMVTGESDYDDGRFTSYTTKARTAEETKREAEKNGLSNVQVRKY